MSTNLPGLCGEFSTEFCDFCCTNDGIDEMKCESGNKCGKKFGIFAVKNVGCCDRNEHRSSRGNYLRQRIFDSVTNTYLTVLFLIVISSMTSANIMGEHCDWSGK